MKSSRKLGIWMLTALVTGNMIGSGVFILPAALAVYGSIGLLAWVFTAVGSIFLALVFAKLGHVLPKLGGPYAYCRDAFGDVMGFIVGYGYFIAICTGNAAVVVATVSYLTVFFPGLAHHPWHAYWVGLSIFWTVTLINIAGVRQAGWFQLLTTILKIIPLILIALVGLFHLNFHAFGKFNVSHLSTLSAFTAAATITLWSFVGLESASVPANDIENPTRDIPRATLWGTVFTALIYISSAIAVMGTIPMHVLAHSPAPYADTARVLLGHWGLDFVSVGALIACVGTLNGWILLQGQVPLAIAQDNLFPQFFKRKNKHGSPYVSLLISGLIITVLLGLTVNPDLVAQFTFIIRLATLGTLVPYFLCGLALVVLFKKYPEKFRQQKFTAMVVLALIACVYSYWMLIGAGTEIIALGTLLLFTGFPLHVWIQQCQKNPALT